MPPDIAEAERLAADMVAEVNAVYGLYLDANAGFCELIKVITRAQDQAGATDENIVFYGDGAPTDPGNVLLHQTTQGALKQRIQEGGRHYYLLARMLVVLLYELWETGYRTPLATAGDVPRNDVLIPIFGDLRLLRHDILHNKGRLKPETVQKLAILAPPASGCVDLGKREVQEIVTHVKTAIDEIVTNWTGHDPAYRTIWHVT
jgi:hypothetical protein